MTNVKCAQCGAINYPGVDACRRCGQSLANAVPLSAGQDIRVSDNAKYGFGGWLLVFSFVTFLYLVRLGFTLVFQVQALGKLSGLTGGGKRGSRLEHVQMLVGFDVVVTGALLIFGLVVIRALRNTREISVTLAVIFLFSSAIFQIIDYFSTRSVLDGIVSETKFRLDTANLIWMVATLVQVLIWWPYFKLSKRVGYGFNN